jgi:hypothetical protein
MSDAFGFGLIEKNHAEEKNKNISFVFSINKDTSVYYSGHYHLKQTWFINSSNNKMEGFQSEQYLSFDLAKVSRDYPNYTNLEIEQITVQLTTAAFNYAVANKIGQGNIIFDVTV